jgi:CDP-glucose 4,6-dehydratase
MRAAIAGEVIRVRNPGAVRPWQHVLNPLSGYLQLAQALTESATAGGGWNFGPADDDVRPVSWIADRLSELWPDELRWEVDPGPHPHEAGYLALDSTKARVQLRWAPAWALDEALGSIVTWYGLLRSGADMRRATLEQIEAFQSRPSTLPRA